MKLKTLLDMFTNDSDCFLRYRKKDVKVYYLGNKICEWENRDNVKPELSEEFFVLNDSNRTVLKDSISDIMSDLENYIIIRMPNKITIKCNKVKYEKNVLEVEHRKEELEKYLCDNNYCYNKPEWKSKDESKEVVYNINKQLAGQPVKWSDFIDFETNIFNKIICKNLNGKSDKLIYKPTISSIKIEYNEESDRNDFKKIIKCYKELIVKYNEISDSLEEKKFQRYLMNENNASILFDNKNYVAFEEEHNILKDSSTTKSGRVDNIYVVDNNLIYMEVKINDSVIEQKDETGNGIKKHLEDINKLVSDSNKLESDINIINKSNEYRKNLNRQYNLNIPVYDKKIDRVKFYIVCGYTSDEMKNSIKRIIKEHNETYKEFVDEITNNNCEVKLFLIPTKKENGQYVKDDKDIEIYNFQRDKFEIKEK